MKKYLSLILALCLPALLGGCGAVPLPMPESPTPPPAADTEEITYEVSTDPYEQTVTAEDGTTLMVIDFQIPHLQAYANGTLIEDPSTPAQEQAMDRVHTFNENFDQWRESNSSEENISFVKDLYRDMPEMFSEDHMAPLSEELTYTCYRTGTLISIAADYYSYLGGAVQAEEQIASTPELEGQSLSDVYWDNYRETLEKWSSDYAASFDADGLTVIFSAYELASYANGPQEFHFPYAALDSYWSDSGRAVLGLD